MGAPPPPPPTIEQGQYIFHHTVFEYAHSLLARPLHTHAIESSLEIKALGAPQAAKPQAAKL